MTSNIRKPKVLLNFLYWTKQRLYIIIHLDHSQPLVDQYFDRMQQILQRGDLPSRIKFMLEDIVELRYNKVSSGYFAASLLVVNGY